MMLKVLPAAFTFILLGLTSVHAVRPVTVFGDFGDAAPLIDGKDSPQISINKPKAAVIAQLGSLQFISGVSLQMKGAELVESAVLEQSSDFIQWKPVKITLKKESSALKVLFDTQAFQFIRITLTLKGPVALSELVLTEAQSPANRITDIKIRVLDQESAVISWKTAVPSQSILSYSKKVNGSKESLVLVDYLTNHEILLKGLLKGTDYQFRVLTQTPDGKKLESPENYFRTMGIPLPEIWELRADSITPYQTTLVYRANVPVTAELFAGADTNQLKLVDAQKNISSNSTLKISGLTPETLYYYMIVLKDARSNVVMTPALPFVTPADNLALGKVVTGTFNFIDPELQKRGFGLTTSQRLVDGNYSYMNGMAISFLADNADQYAVVDLGREEKVSRAEIYWWALGFSRDYRLDCSSDGKTWVTIAAKLDADKAIDYRSPSGDYLLAQRVDVAKTARYFRVYMQAGSKRGTKSKKFAPRPQYYLCEIALIKDVK